MHVWVTWHVTDVMWRDQRTSAGNVRPSRFNYFHTDVWLWHPGELISQSEAGIWRLDQSEAGSVTPWQTEENWEAHTRSILWAPGVTRVMNCAAKMSRVSFMLCAARGIICCQFDIWLDRCVMSHWSWLTLIEAHNQTKASLMSGNQRELEHSMAEEWLRLSRLFLIHSHFMSVPQWKSI